jgi:hypothetical protein
VKYRIHAKNPKTQQAHDFEVESGSMADARQMAEAAGLVLLNIMPAPGADAAPRDDARKAQRRRRFALRSGRRSVDLVLLAGILIAVATTISILLSGSPTGFEPLDASIRFDGYQFKITNRDAFAWKDVRIDLNGGITHSGYLHHPGTIVAGQAYTAPVTSFCNDKGFRFSPISDSPGQMTITCELEGGRTGRYTKRWN